MQLQEKSINLLYSRYLCVPQGWNDRYKSYSTSDTVSGIRRIDSARRYCDVPYMRPAYRKPMSIFSPRLYMRWREDVCSLVRNYRNLNYFKRFSTPFPKCCEPECLSTHLDWTARLWRCRGFSFECSVFNFFPLPLFRSFFFRWEYFPFIFDRQYQEPPLLCKSYFVVKRAGSLSKKPTRRSRCRCD